jgi:hypothetical protein
MEGTLLFICFVSPIVALSVAAASCPRFVAAVRERGVSNDVLSQFAGGVLRYGLSFGTVGYVLGTLAFCIVDGGAQCGLGGVFFTGPLRFASRVLRFLYSSFRRAA